MVHIYIIISAEQPSMANPYECNSASSGTPTPRTQALLAWGRGYGTAMQLLALPGGLSSSVAASLCRP